ncbi:MAG: small, acid-soluble spore protein, H family [Peptostreptococcaceae bacterium]|nr:small, acid-soluble spore protein, H family [Peptostreptococcaceae bacterium]
MQLRRAMEIVNGENNNVNSKIFYKENQVNLISVDNNIGTAYVESLDGNYKYEVDLEQLNEITY